MFKGRPIDKVRELSQVKITRVTENMCFFMYWSSGCNYCFQRFSQPMSHCNVIVFGIILAFIVCYRKNCNSMTDRTQWTSMRFCLCSLFLKTISCLLDWMSLKEHTYGCGSGQRATICAFIRWCNRSHDMNYLSCYGQNKTRLPFFGQADRQTGKPFMLYEQNGFLEI